MALNRATLTAESLARIPPPTGCHQDGADWVVYLRIQARASRDAFCGRWDNYQKLAIKAPPINGAANKAVQNYLAHAFGVAKSQVSIEKGAASTLKKVRITAPRKIPPELQIK